MAGACAAHYLSRYTRVTLLDTARPAAGASGVAAGIATPFAGQRARPACQHAQAMEALRAVLEAARQVPDTQGLLRPAADAQQARVFQERASEHAEALTWLTAEAAQSHWPDVQADLGALWVREARALDVAAFVEKLIAASSIETRFGANGHLTSLEMEQGWMGGLSDVVAGADLAVLCTGASLPGVLQRLPLHRVKGQIITLYAPNLAHRLPPIAGAGYLVPDGDTVVVGSTFEHVFTDTAPTEAGMALLREKAMALVPALHDAPLQAARAGVRTTVPGVRRPLLGPITRSGRVWVFNGLGARGLLTAPLLASRLPLYLSNTDAIPSEIRPPLLD